MAGEIMADWSKLPYDILHKVSTYLTAIEDFLAFSAVCSSWQSVYSAKQWRPGPQIPLLMFSNHENSSSRSFLSLYRNQVSSSDLPEARGRRCFGSSSGWLLTIGSDLQIHLLNPFTRDSVNLPPKSSLKIQFGEILDWCDVIEKAIVFNKPSNSDPNGPDLVVMIIYGPLRQLAYCRPGFTSWRSIKDTPNVGFLDVAFVKDEIFALCDMGSLVIIDIDREEVVDVDGGHLPKNVPLSLPCWDWEELFLVEASGSLWMVLRNNIGDRKRCSVGSTKFEFYGYDFDKKKWVRLSDLGNQTLFVGDGCAFSISVPNCLKWKMNSVYFVGVRNEEGWPSREFNVDIGVYSMTNGCSKPLHHGPDVTNYHCFPTWVMPSLK